MSKHQIKILKFLIPTCTILSLAYYLNSKPYTLYLGGLLVLISLVAPQVILKIISYLEVISPYISKAIYIPLLTISFFFLIWPFGVLRKLFKKDKINNKKFYQDTESNFVDSVTEYTKEDLLHPF